MFLRRSKSTTPSFHQNSVPPFSFSCSSFKDIHSLFDEETTTYSITSSNPKPPTLNVLHRVRSAKLLLRALSKDIHSDADFHHLAPGGERRVIIFFTSLRVVRSTFEDCKYVRSVLHSFPVAIDERDLFMDGGFMKELERMMGKEEKGGFRLPRVFIGGRYFGGAEEIRRMHEAGELKKCLQGLAPKVAGTCEGCLGHGFVLCVECSGSHKCYVEKGGFRACSGCNENGLVRCGSCSSAPL